MRFKEFFDSLLDGKLIGQKCKDCGAYTCPPKACCDNCGSRNLEIVELSGKGKIATFTTTYVAPVGYDEEAPYVVAMVELDEGPWIVGRIDVDPNEAEDYGQELIGKKVKIYGKEFPVEPYYPDKQRRVVPMFKLED
ncbi:nucleic acid-binding protein [Archaeoglobales archaeon ex4484_92]|nr:MAG: nucleic acid-binding protein [Archaeoglobales archaeon ex4484_92]